VFEQRSPLLGVVLTILAVVVGLATIFSCVIAFLALVKPEQALVIISELSSLPTATPVVIVVTPPAPTPFPTYTPLPTYTPYPTYTPLPTPTPQSTPPTATPAPPPPRGIAISGYVRPKTAPRMATSRRQLAGGRWPAHDGHRIGLATNDGRRREMGRLRP
jgi:hypothetical protein